MTRNVRPIFRFPPAIADATPFPANTRPAPSFPYRDSYCSLTPLELTNKGRQLRKKESSHGITHLRFIYEFTHLCFISRRKPHRDPPNETRIARCTCKYSIGTARLGGRNDDDRLLGDTSDNETGTKKPSLRCIWWRRGER